MSRQELIEKTVKSLSLLPDIKVMEVADFADFLTHRLDDKIIQKGIRSLSSNSSIYKMLDSEDNNYTVNDLKEEYKAK